MPHHRSRSGRRPAALATALTLLGTPALPGCSTARGHAPGRASSPAGRVGDAIQRRLDDLVRKDGYPAVLAAVRGRDGRVRDYTAGVANLRTRATVPVDGQVRIGSITKGFTSAVILQLVGEGRIGLDKPVETYLPGLIRGAGIDGRRITVRQILQHTSGLPEYTTIFDRHFPSYQHVYMEPRALLDLALKQRAHFAPGTRWEYSNTNYIVAGLIIEKVTGRPVIEEITNRVIKRAGLRHTYFPAVGDQTIHEAHPQGYAAEAGAAGPLRDVTELDPSWAWSAGQIVSTSGDLIRYLAALLGGRLLQPAQLKEMRTTVGTGDKRGAAYGLGLFRAPLPCGGAVWGHNGGIPGYSTADFAAEDGRAIAIAATAEPVSDVKVAHLDAAVISAFCP
ncbi:serine hydrolase domain-containing protein [Actinoallomurus rhizosphaericola]|uniref:serine hydrolase domain-containing protein n=1 Tax=Actinoallomurus rhizosphaericola TaxID=2952536 RepID=UPI002093169F|nr:serine hydrolase domain-containing protein [Actinoallomurus rhizosphaericola]MCO5999706.1 beta-lactamase family protein [Actinoallomurus rhizosphaericola]